jgi:hypothetical protein
MGYDRRAFDRTREKPRSIDTSQDLSVTWLPISIGQIDFELTGWAPFSFAISLACTFGGAAGSGIVPRTLLPR